MALAANVALPQFRPAASAPERATIWIAADWPPARAQSWPVLVPIPLGWHEVTEEEARRILSGTAPLQGVTIAAPPDSLSSEVAALLSSPPDPSRRQESRLPREPRTPRTPRPPRAPRTVRASRIFREPRPPRPPRPPRRPRRARAARPPRPPRPRAYKTTQPPGVCKGPACNCWTPGGCTGAWYLELLPAFKGSACYRGPCYSYEACVSEACTLHPACLVNTILQFWARQFRAVAAGQGLELVSETVGELGRLASRARRVLPAMITDLVSGGPLTLTEGVTEGCPPGTRWAVGLTGYSCQSPYTHPIAATREELIAAGILRA